MKNKIKLIDRLKSWLVTLGIASVFGLAALGVNAANSYQKTSAYEYDENSIVFECSSRGNEDTELLYEFLSLQTFDSNHLFSMDYFYDISVVSYTLDSWLSSDGVFYPFDSSNPVELGALSSDSFEDSPTITVYSTSECFDDLLSFLGIDNNDDDDFSHSADLTFNVSLDEDDLPSYDLQVLNAYFVNLLGHNDEIFVDLSFEISGTLYHADRFGYNDGSYYLIDDNADAIYQINNGSYRITEDYIGTWVFNPTYTRNQQYYALLTFSQSYNAPQSSGNFITALTSFMSLIGGGIVQLAQSVGAGVVSFASGLFLDSGHLSILGGIIGIFAGIALAVGITSKVYTWVSTLGN